MRIQQLIIYPILGFLLVCSQTLLAQKYSNEFLSIGVSARAQAMGNAVVASTNDVTSGYWNPAGLAFLSKNAGLQIGAMHAEWFAGVGKFDYVGMAMPSSNGRSRFGLTFIRFGIDNIPNTLSLFEDDGTINYDNISEFSAADYAFMLNYGREIDTEGIGRLAVGGNVKIIRRLIGSFADSWGFGLDLSLQYRLKNWRMGLLARDVTTTFNAWNFQFTSSEIETLFRTGNDVPISSTEITRPQLILGIGHQFQFGDIRVTPEFNAVATTDGRRNTLISAEPISIDPSMGVEVKYNELIALRAGINQFQQLSDLDRSDYWTARPSLGVGLKLSNLAIDYAFTDIGDSRNTYSHIVSLLLELKPRAKRDE